MRQLFLLLQPLQQFFGAHQIVMAAIGAGLLPAQLCEIIRLQPQNDTMDPIIVRDVQILGKVIGVFRFFD